MSYEARIPVSTYRLQFNYQFTFADAARVVPYLSSLGITDVYSSPYFKAQPGSLHGYDIVDPTALNPEVGAEEDYSAFIDALRTNDMGQILDIVPNHMCITDRDNVWWMDILENGPSSVYADYFDINWVPVKKELTNRVLLPFLGDQYGKVLERQELPLTFENGSFFITYYDHKFPLTPKTYADVLGYRIEELGRTLGAADPAFMELLSIITALNNLPHYTETDEVKTSERYREQEIIKRRLRDLCGGSPEVRAFIGENVTVLNGSRGDRRSFDALDALVGKQPYRLSYWRVATDEINYRRFFDINQIAAVKMEGAAVYRDTHRLIFRLVEEGKVTGFRVDHPDGLYDPAEYFRWLQHDSFLRMNLGNMKRLKEDLGLPAFAGRPELEAKILERYEELLLSDPRFKPFYIVGEKILTKGEKMPGDWPIFSTTGYVFMNSLNGIFIDGGSVEEFDRLYAKFIGSKMLFPEVVYEKKKLMMQVSMSSEIHTLGHYLNEISERDRHTRDFTLNSLTAAIAEVIAFFPVYRTYITASGVSDTDRRYIELAVAKAKRKNPAISGNIYDFLRDVLLLRYPENISDDARKEWFGFVKKFQQVTGPVMAKGLEDTAFYVYNRFISLNEVGGSPDRFGLTLEAFHGQNLERNKHWPHALIATSTHDSKRGEDVRARINVLSEMPGEWRRRVIRWRRFNKKKKPLVEGAPAPDANEEYFFYQTLAGAWPIGGSEAGEFDEFVARVKDYMLKAVREAKVNSSWINANKAHEEALLAFIGAALEKSDANLFLRDFEEFHKRISFCGMINALSQVLLKITSPGVPDIYQGNELWNFSLVDPDNRRPVDYGIRIRMLDELRRREAGAPLRELAGELAANMRDGRIKLFLTCKALNFRKSRRELFERGEYIALETGGPGADNLCAFAKRLDGAVTITAAVRLCSSLVRQPGSPPMGTEAWKDSYIILPFERPGARYRHIFTGELLTAAGGAGAAVIHAGDAFAHFPAALAERIN